MLSFWCLLLLRWILVVVVIFNERAHALYVYHYPVAVDDDNVFFFLTWGGQTFELLLLPLTAEGGGLLG